MGLGVPPLTIKIVLESNPPKSMILVGRFGRMLKTPSEGFYMCVYIYIYIYTYICISVFNVYTIIIVVMISLYYY